MPTDYGRGKFLNLISQNNHKVVKYMHIAADTSAIRCRKIVLVKTHKKTYIEHIFNQTQQIKDYLTRRLSCNTQIDLKDILEVTNKQIDHEHIQIRIDTPYEQSITLSEFYNTDRLQMMKSQFKVLTPNEAGFSMHIIRQLFELVTRAGGLDNFLYTPKNIFFQKPSIKKQQDFNLFQTKLLLNYTSLTAVKLFFSKEQISKRDLQQIYPCLPCDYQNYITVQEEGVVKDKKSLQKLNVVIKMRAFGWLLFTFVIKQIPTLLQFEGNELTMKRFQVMQKIRQSSQIFEELLGLPLYRKKIYDFQRLVGIRLLELLQEIFINNCQKLDWQIIYKYLFPNTLFLQEQYHQQMLEEMWRRECVAIKNFFNKRRLSSKTNHVYCLVKMNQNYHEILQEENIAALLLFKQFCRISFKTYLNILHQKRKPNLKRGNIIQQEQFSEYMSTNLPSLENTVQAQDTINRKQNYFLYSPQNILKNTQNQIYLTKGQEQSTSSPLLQVFGTLDWKYKTIVQVKQKNGLNDEVKLQKFGTLDWKSKNIVQIKQKNDMNYKVKLQEFGTLDCQKFETLDQKYKNIVQVKQNNSTNDEVKLKEQRPLQMEQILNEYPAKRLFRGLIRTQLKFDSDKDRYTICSAPKQLTCILDMQRLFW